MILTNERNKSGRNGPDTKATGINRNKILIIKFNFDVIYLFFKNSKNFIGNLNKRIKMFIFILCSFKIFLISFVD